MQGNSKPSKKANKGKTPVTTKKRKALPSDTSESKLVDFLEKKRDLRSQKLTVDCVKEIAKIFKGDA